MIGLLAALLLAQDAFDTSHHRPIPIRVHASPFPGLDGPKAVGCLALRAGLTLSAGGGGFGGYSDIVLTGPDGAATILSDNAHMMHLRLLTDDEGDAVGVADTELRVLHERDGSGLGKRDGDGEGLAWLGGGYAVSFEGEHRIARMDAAGKLGAPLRPTARLAEVFGGNSGLEALTVLPDGRLLAMSEGLDADGTAVVLRGDLGTQLSDWDRARYRPAKGFNVTGAATDSLTGDLFVLERAYSPWRGARMRIVRVPKDGLDDDALAGRELTRMGFLEGVDNMEGIAAARTEAGDLRLYLVSDDNYSAAQRTVLLTLGEAGDCPS